MGNWPESVETIVRIARERGIDLAIEEVARPLDALEDVASSVGCQPGEVVQTVLVICDERPLAVLFPGDSRASLAKVARAAGAQNADLAPAPLFEDAGLEPTLLPPFGLPVEHVLIDFALLRAELVWAPAGSPRHLLSVRPPVLVEALGAQAVDVIERDG